MKLAILFFSFVLIVKYSLGQKGFNDTLSKQLETIYNDDQTSRDQLESVQKKFSWGSKEMKAVMQTMNEKDSINEIKVTAILDKYGWLGTDIIGITGNDALFLVIQHAGLSTQEKYLPMMREAV